MSVARLLLGLGLLAALAAGAAAPARADVLTAQAGPVSAALTFDPSDDAAEKTFPLAIDRAGQRLFDAPVAVENCGGPYCVPATADAGSPLRVLDLDADGEPEVLASFFWGGAHCCFIQHVFALDAAGGGYRDVVHEFGDPGARIANAGGDARPEFISADFTFAYDYASFAGSGMPVQIWRFQRGRFVDVTSRFPSRIRRDANRWWRRYRQALRADAEQLGVLAAWAADQYRLGRRTQTLRTLRRELRRGHLRVADPLGPQGAAFIRALDRRLRRTGYA